MLSRYGAAFSKEQRDRIIKNQTLSNSKNNQI